MEHIIISQTHQFSHRALTVKTRDIQQIEKPTKEEITQIIKTVRNNKRPGSNRITATEVLSNRVYQLVQGIWQNKQILKDWEKSTIILLFIKGDEAECHNYIGFSLLKLSLRIDWGK